MSVMTFVLRRLKPESLEKSPPLRRFHYGARLVTTVFFLPFAAIVCTVVVFLSVGKELRPWTGVFGAAAASLLCAIAALFCHFVEPEHGIPTSYAELLQRLERLKALTASLSQYDELQNTAEYLETLAQLQEIELTLQTSGMHWVMGHGYTNAWARLHRAEEALIELAPLDDVYEAAEYDELRLADSAVPNRDALTAKLRSALDAIRAAATTETSTALTRATVRNVRRAINEYRDQLWNGLIVARNRLFETCALTAAAFYAIEATAIANEVQQPEMIAATFFWAIGAAVGLGKRLREDSRAGSASIDEGLSAARLITIPLFSGFAAVCGVALTAIVPADQGTLTAVFTVNAKNFLVAAIFGLTPDLLFDSLQQRSEKLKKGLTSSAAAGQS
jgi:hypothetical protein